MLDIKLIRKDPAGFRANLAKRKNAQVLEWFDVMLREDANARKAQGRLDELRAERNQLTAQVKEAKKKGENAQSILEHAAKIPEEIKKAEAQEAEARSAAEFLLKRIPNTLHDSVPYGEGEEGNEVVREVKGHSPEFQAKSHVDILATLGLADFERAAKISGARFYFLKGKLVQLEMALMNYAMDYMVSHGFTPIVPPYMLNRKAYEGVTDLAAFEDAIYKIQDEDLHLIATSEHPIGAMHSGEIFERDDLPLKYAGISPCFRKEAGAHGKDMKGIFRVHQFQKVEQFVTCLPEDSWEWHEKLLLHAEDLVKTLELPYRVVNICTGDIGTIAAKKYDIETWMPAQNAYRELISCSNCTSYQAVRSQMKYRVTKGSEEKDFLHTLNSTALPSTRTLVAIIENYQREDGSIQVPRALQEYLPFSEISLEHKE